MIHSPDIDRLFEADEVIVLQWGHMVSIEFKNALRALTGKRNDTEFAVDRRTFGKLRDAIGLSCCRNLLDWSDGHKFACSVCNGYAMLNGQQDEPNYCPWCGSFVEHEKTGNKEHSMGKHTIQKRVPILNQEPTTDEILEARRRYGMSAAQLATHLGTDEYTVREALEQENAEPWPHQPATKTE